MFKKLFEPDELPTRQFLVAYLWYNEISKVGSNSSLIIDLEPGEKMNADKIHQLQDEILGRISTMGVVNDPDSVVITGFYLLEPLGE